MGGGGHRSVQKKYEKEEKGGEKGVKRGVSFRKNSNGPKKEKEFHELGLIKRKFHRVRSGEPKKKKKERPDSNKGGNGSGWRGVRSNME